MPNPQSLFSLSPRTGGLGVSPPTAPEGGDRRLGPAASGPPEVRVNMAEAPVTEVQEKAQEVFELEDSITTYRLQKYGVIKAEIVVNVTKSLVAKVAEITDSHVFLVDVNDKWKFDYRGGLNYYSVKTAVMDIIWKIAHAKAEEIVKKEPKTEINVIIDANDLTDEDWKEIRTAYELAKAEAEKEKE